MGFWLVNISCFEHVAFRLNSQCVGFSWYVMLLDPENGIVDASYSWFILSLSKTAWGSNFAIWLLMLEANSSRLGEQIITATNRNRQIQQNTKIMFNLFFCYSSIQFIHQKSLKSSSLLLGHRPPKWLPVLMVSGHQTPRILLGQLLTKVILFVVVVVVTVVIHVSAL